MRRLDHLGRQILLHCGYCQQPREHHGDLPRLRRGRALSQDMLSLRVSTNCSIAGCCQGPFHHPAETKRRFRSTPASPHRAPRSQIRTESPSIWRSVCPKCLPASWTPWTEPLKAKTAPRGMDGRRALFGTVVCSSSPATNVCYHAPV